MFTVFAVVAAVIGIIWTRKSEIIIHDPLDGAKPPLAERVTAPLQSLERVVQVVREEAARQAAAAQQAEDEDSDESIDQQDIIDLIREGKHLAALKLYREATGADLDTAQRYIDKLRGQ